MKPILVGTRALTYFVSLDLNKTSYDLVVPNEVISKEPSADYLVSEKLYNLLLPHTEKTLLQGVYILSPAGIMAFKLAHLNQNDKWEEHLGHIEQLNRLGFTPNWELFSQLYRFWKENYPLK